MILQNSTVPTILLLDDNNKIPYKCSGTAYHWNGLLKEEGAISIPDYIELNSDRIREKYIQFIYELGQKQIYSGRLSDSLITYKGYNLWWMSTIVEKNLVKSPSISDCLKLFALEEIIITENASHIIFFSSNKKLTKAIGQLCHKLGIVFENRIVLDAKNKKVTNAKNFIPFYLKGVLYIIRAIFQFWPLRKSRKHHWQEGNCQVFMFSQFINFELDASSEHYLYSNYWKMLPKFLHDRGLQMNVMNNFHFSNLVPNAQTGVSILNEMNRRSNAHSQVHRFLYSYVSLKTLVFVLFRFSVINLLSFRLKGVKKITTARDSDINFWVLMEKDWRDSFEGTVLAENLLFIHLIDKVAKTMPAFKLGLYLQENNGWERALIHAWKKYQSSPIIGVPHTTIRYWDLRYIEDKRLFQSKGEMLPRPNFVAINGPVAKSILLSSGYKENELVEVEALRYMDIEIPANKNKDLTTNQKCLNVLLCGDIDIHSTQAMLTCVKEAVNLISEKNINIDFAFTYKSHPVTQVNIELVSIPFLIETKEDLVDILSSFQVIIATDSTSAAVEAYLTGLQVIVYTYPRRLNFSPLKGIKGISFVNTPAQLKACLTESIKGSLIKEIEPFFWIERTLPGWSKLFKNAGYSNFN
jgi:surface carbohydrate biosynthesis protein (TIGR04326 family)